MDPHHLRKVCFFAYLSRSEDGIDRPLEGNPKHNTSSILEKKMRLTERDHKE